MTHLLLVLALAFDLTAVKSEPNLEKRSELALDTPTSPGRGARRLQRRQRRQDAERAAGNVRFGGAGVRSRSADTGKDPRKDPKFFKRAELRTSELAAASGEPGAGDERLDHGTLDNVRARISEVHDNLLKGIMTRKKK